MGYEQIIIAPSILSADFTRLGEQIWEAEQGGANWIHVDVMDGQFVPNITMGPMIVSAARRVTQLPLDVHLMIADPDRYIPAFAKAGASIISVHIEACPNLYRTLQLIQEMGCRVGVAINPHTPSFMLKEVLPMTDVVNVMTVNPGFGGQAFLPSMMSKVAEIRAMAGNIRRYIDIEVDGGITDDTASAAAQCGANVLIAGTAIFQHPKGIQAGIRALRESLE